MEEIMPLLGLVLLCVFLVFGRWRLRGRMTATEEEAFDQKQERFRQLLISRPSVIATARESLKPFRGNFFELIAIIGLAFLLMMLGISRVPLVILCVFLIFEWWALRVTKTAPEEETSEEKTDLSPLSRLSFFGIVGKSIGLYKDNFFKLIAISSLVSLPMMFLFTILRIPRAFNHLITIQPLIMAVVAVAVADELSGEHMSIIRSYRCVLKRTAPLALAALLACFVLNLARMTLSGVIYPIFVVWLVFVPQQAVVGQESGWRALIQSRRLVRHHFWRVAGLIIIAHGALVGISSAVVMGAANVLLENANVPWIMLLTFMTSASGNLSLLSGDFLIRQILNIFVVPLSATMMALCYYQLRGEKGEAKDIRLLHDRGNRWAEAAIVSGFLLALLLFLSVAPVSFLPNSLPFYMGLWKWETDEGTIETVFVSEINKHGGIIGEMRQDWTTNELLPLEIQYAHHRGIRQPTVSVEDGMILIPAGTFIMGSPDGKGEDDERPEHRVHLDAYYIDQHEVTNSEYKRFVDATDHRAPEHWWKWRWGGKAHHPTGKGNHPVVGVSWADASAYAKWAGKRLPTEAEWEKAARGTDGRLFPWGNEFHQNIRGERVHANIHHRYFIPYEADGALVTNETALNDGMRYVVEDGYKPAPLMSVTPTAPVGRFPSGASPYGVMDMAGNVMEWVADWYTSDYFVMSPQRDQKRPGINKDRVVRGGSWGGIPYYVRCATRYHTVPRQTSQHIGFRCARGVPH